MPTDVDCPHCGGFLFKYIVKEGMGFRTGDAPKVEEDHGKHFMTCPQEGCQKRIDLDYEGTGWVISPFQKGV